MDWDVSEYVDTFGFDFLNALCEVPKRYPLGELYTARVKKYALRDFHRFLSDNDSYSRVCSFSESVKYFGTVGDWTLISVALRNYIAERPTANSTKNKFIYGFNYWMKGLQHAGFIPRFPLLQSFKVEDKVSESLIEFKLPDDVEKELGVEEVELEELEIVIENLTKELKDFEAVGLVDAAIAVLERRLKLVREAAEHQYHDARRLRLNGLVSIRRGRVFLPVTNEWIAAPAGTQGVTPKIYSEIESLSDADFVDAYFSWCWYANKGLPLKHHDSLRYNRVRKEIRRRHIDLNDQKCLHAFGCGQRLWAASVLLLVHDLYGNVDSIRKIKYDADNLDGFGIKVIDWEKLRAGADLTHNDFRVDKSSPTSVIRTVRNATRRFRIVALSSDRERLFLHYHSSKTWRKDRVVNLQLPALPSSNSVTVHTKDIIAQASGNQWYGTAKSIRISRLLLLGLKRGLVAIQEAASHSSLRTSKVYANKVVMTRRLEEAMWEFKTWMQTLITIHLDDVALKLDIDGQSYEQVKSSILKSRFGGVFCKEPTAGVQPGTVKGSFCHRVSRCLICPNKRKIFIATESNLVEVIQWNEALQKAITENWIDLEKDDHWLYWTIFLETILLKMEKGGARYSALLASAKNTANRSVNNYLRVDFSKV
jgi:hypothetical protein